MNYRSGISDQALNVLSYSTFGGFGSLDGVSEGFRLVGSPPLGLFRLSID